MLVAKKKEKTYTLALEFGKCYIIFKTKENVKDVSKNAYVKLYYILV